MWEQHGVERFFNACGGITSNPATVIPESPQSYSPSIKITNNLSRYCDMYHTIQKMVSSTALAVVKNCFRGAAPISLFQEKKDFCPDQDKNLFLEDESHNWFDNCSSSDLAPLQAHNQTLTTKWVVLWLQGWMCDMHHIFTLPYFFILWFLIPTSPQYIARVFCTLRRNTTLNNLDCCIGAN